ncbi:hypothetical protein IIO_06408 [Bacillus cereus VD115]|nr:hypothetical protein IIO_06408 [Bacillus cereus VD115]
MFSVVAVLIFLIILVNVVFLALGIELSHPLKIALRGILTCLILLAIIQLF